MGVLLNRGARLVVMAIELVLVFAIAWGLAVVREMPRPVFLLQIFFGFWNMVGFVSLARGPWRKKEVS